MELKKTKAAFWKQLNELGVYERAVGKLYYDLSTATPEEGMEQAGEDMAVISQNVHRITHSKKYTENLEALYVHRDELEPLEKRAVTVRYLRYQKEKNISPKLALEIDNTLGRAYGAWMNAKKSNDYSLFKDSLESIAALTRKTILLRDEHPEQLYDACLDDNEEGGNTRQLDAFFAKLREGIIPLLRRIVAEGKPIREDFLTRPCPIAEQERFSHELLEIEGLRSTALTLGTTEHPFTTNFGAKDVRVTTHYHEELFLSNIFSTLHEGGHALFMQFEPEAFAAAHVDNLMSNGMHETISRFYENLIGRSEEFIHFIYPKLCKLSPTVMEGVSERELYEGVNIARPSLIRTEADELSYCLHIMIRYEIERDLVNGSLAVADIPAVWKQKYGQYLGIDVPDDASGCLQDMHWTSGFGYFPSYALGNAYSVQILRRMEKDMDVWGCVKAGQLDKIRDWLSEHVFSKASLMSPEEWIVAVTGEKLNPDYYLAYLQEKYTKLYGLK